MIKGFYDATAGMQARALQQETISNNLANVSTEGYRGQRMAFRTLLDHNLVVDRPGGEVGKWNKLEDGRYNIHEQGSLRTTGNQLDVAIEGDGFFGIETPSGPAYTRNGNFTIDTTGKLMTPAGYPVRLEGGGTIQLPSGADVVIGRDGLIKVGEAVLGRLELVTIDPNAKLDRLGDNLIRPVDDQAVTGGVAIQQGMLEDSNVNALREMVDMISSSRMFETLSKSLTTIDDTMRVAINDVGRTQ